MRGTGKFEKNRDREFLMPQNRDQNKGKNREFPVRDRDLTKTGKKIEKKSKNFFCSKYLKTKPPNLLTPSKPPKPQKNYLVPVPVLRNPSLKFVAINLIFNLSIFISSHADQIIC